ncbi:hypothetical protein C8R34_11066 [Nitrosomonas sp. Nm84]|uniref:beta strand repeat-containing protein n=1 Tax=Nitrosomonas sp. Nm84 TaxID=200124 RepID=UPI000D7736E6|nr:hypothetical protein [Nitrosomonas sp. Nm84]PXW87650.1 hypothetical protein C8R34_11066 [Nitrosomonas sp. Nm84]
MAITPEQRDDILQVVVGLFNGSPDGNTLTELSDLVESGVSIDDLADLLAAHSAFRDNILAGNVTTDDQVAILMNHFGLVADDDETSAGSQAEAYFAQKLGDGEGFGKIVFDAVTFLTTGNPAPEFADTVALLNNKVLVAKLYAQSNPSDDISAMLSTLAGVSASTPTTEAEALAYLDGIGQGPNPGTSDSLIFGADALTGTSGNDTFNAGIVNNGAGTLVESLESVDNIDGGSGKDTLNATLDGGTPAPTLASVEVVNIRAVTSSTVDFANTSGVQQIWNNGSSAGQTLTVNAASIAATFGVRNTTSTTAIDVADDVATGTEDTLALSVAGAGKSDVPTRAAVTSADSANIEAVSIAAAGENFLDISGFTAITTLTVTGKGSLDALVGATALTTVDASANSGGVTVDLSAATLDLTVTGGSGDDDITSGTGNDTIDAGAGDDRVAFAAGELTVDDTVEGGDGDDTIAVDGADTGALDNASQTGFEALEITGGTATVDATGFDFTKIVLSGTATALTANNFENGTVEVKVPGATVTNVTVASVGAEDALGLVVNAEAAVTLAAVDITDVETVNVSTTSDLDDTTFTTIETDGVTALTFAGAGDVIVAAVTDADTANDATTKIATVDLTAQTGIFEMVALGYGTTYKLGNSGDVELNGAVNSRDTFEFTTAFDNEVLITSGEFGGDVSDDKIDLSALEGLTGIDDLTFTNNAGDLEITSDAFDGTIVLAGTIANDVNVNDFIF